MIQFDFQSRIKPENENIFWSCWTADGNSMNEFISRFLYRKLWRVYRLLLVEICLFFYREIIGGIIDTFFNVGLLIKTLLMGLYTCFHSMMTLEAAKNVCVNFNGGELILKPWNAVCSNIDLCNISMFDCSFRVQ